MNGYEHKTNACTHDTRTRPSSLVGDTPTPIEVRRTHGNKYLGTITTTSGYIVLLQTHRLTPSDVGLDCCIEQARVWNDFAWLSPELAEYTSDGGVA